MSGYELASWITVTAEELAGRRPIEETSRLRTRFGVQKLTACCKSITHIVISKVCTSGRYMRCVGWVLPYAFLPLTGSGVPFTYMRGKVERPRFMFGGLLCGVLLTGEMARQLFTLCSEQSCSAPGLTIRTSSSSPCWCIMIKSIPRYSANSEKLTLLRCLMFPHNAP